MCITVIAIITCTVCILQVSWIESWVYIPNPSLLKSVTWMDLTPEIYHEADIPFDMDLISGPVIPKNMNNKAIVNCTSNFTYFPLYVEDVSIQSNYGHAALSQI